MKPLSQNRWIDRLVSIPAEASRGPWAIIALPTHHMYELHAALMVSSQDMSHRRPTPPWFGKGAPSTCLRHRRLLPCDECGDDGQHDGYSRPEAGEPAAWEAWVAADGAEE